MTLWNYASAVSAFVPYTARQQTQNLVRTAMQMAPSPPPQDDTQLMRYNDDAFGLVFLAGGSISQDADFAGTFLLISAAAATATYGGALKPDARVPGVVAILTLFVSPLVAALRSAGSLDDVVAPLPIEIGLCVVSLAVALFNWKRAQK